MFKKLSFIKIKDPAEQDQSGDENSDDSMSYTFSNKSSYDQNITFFSQLKDGPAAESQAAKDSTGSAKVLLPWENDQLRRIHRFKIQNGLEKMKRFYDQCNTKLSHKNLQLSEHNRRYGQRRMTKFERTFLERKQRHLESTYEDMRNQFERQMCIMNHRLNKHIRTEVDRAVPPPRKNFLRNNKSNLNSRVLEHLSIEKRAGHSGLEYTQADLASTQQMPSLNVASKKNSLDHFIREFEKKSSQEKLPAHKEPKFPHLNFLSLEEAKTPEPKQVTTRQ